MPNFVWNSSYSVNVKRFDEEHQQLFAILNDLNDGMMAKRGQEILQGILNRLLQYTEKHFAAEESAMRSARYPQLQAQVEQHDKFTKKIKEVIAKQQAGQLGLSIDILDFLTNWLKQHIIGMDKQYSGFLNAQNIV